MFSRLCEYQTSWSSAHSRFLPLSIRLPGYFTSPIHPSYKPFLLPLSATCLCHPLSLHISPCRHHRLYPSRSVFITWNIALSVPLSTVSQSVTPFLYLPPAYRSISASLNIFLCASSSAHVCIMPLLCFAPCVSSSDSLWLLSLSLFFQFFFFSSWHFCGLWWPTSMTAY